jgi:hypothetical protein
VTGVRSRARRTLLGALVVAVVAAATPVGAAERTAPLAVGDAAPDVELRDQSGRPFVLREVLKEREFVILAFYPKAFTSG